jgi:hypothetical protein
MASTQEYPFDLQLPAQPRVLDVELFNELNIIYNAIKIIADYATGVIVGQVSDTLVAGDGIVISTDPGTGLITISSTDAWNYVFLNSDLESETNSPVNAALSFTPVANTSYIIEGQLIVEAVDSGAIPEVGINWSSGLNWGIGELRAPNTATGQNVSFGNDSADMSVQAENLSAGEIFPASVRAAFSVGASPSGTFAITLASGA